MTVQIVDRQTPRLTDCLRRIQPRATRPVQSLPIIGETGRGIRIPKGSWHSNHLG